MYTKIAVIDSGVNLEHPDLKNARIVSLYINSDKNFEITQSSNDSYGHGTACAWIIHNEFPEAEIYSIQVLSKEGTADAGIVIEALKWCITNGIKYINLSMGSFSTRYLDMFNEVGDLASRNEVSIFSALNDEGFASIPASLPGYIGVFSDSDLSKGQYSWDEEKGVIGCFGKMQRVGWPNSPFYAFLCGSSFATAHAVGQIAKMISSERIEAGSNVIEFIKANATVVKKKIREKYNHNDETIYLNNSSPFEIKKATIYGYTKEMHALIKYNKLTNIEIMDIFDSSWSGNIGKKIKYNNREIQIKLIGSDVQLNSDAIIVSKVNKLSRLTGVDFLKKAIEFGIEQKQNIYSLEYVDYYMYPSLFEKAKKENLRIRHPLITEKELAHAKSILEIYGHLGTQIPIVGVFGTGTSQGKFTLQIKLRETFESDGVKVKNIGTEMHSELFGFESFYPLEILKSIRFSQWDMMEYLKGEMRRLEIENPKPDIIVVGSQSGTIPKSYAIKNTVGTLPSIAFLMGTVPHCYILVFNAKDDAKYVSDTISAIQSIGKGKVICMVFSPVLIDKGQEKRLSIKEIENVRAYWEKLFSINVFTNDESAKIAESVYRYFK